MRQEGKDVLVELQNTVRKKVITLHHVECHRSRGKEMARKCAAFIANPFGFTKKQL